jgi:hypothetical protein
MDITKGSRQERKFDGDRWQGRDELALEQGVSLALRKKEVKVKAKSASMPFTRLTRGKRLRKGGIREGTDKPYFLRHMPVAMHNRLNRLSVAKGVDKEGLVVQALVIGLSTLERG